MIGLCTAIRVLMCRLRRTVPHTVITMGQAATGMPDSAEDLKTAPEHVVDLLLGMMRPYPERPDGPPHGSVDYARAARAEARIYADRIWAEAAHAGATYALAIARTRIQVIEVTPPKMSELRACVSESVQLGDVDAAAAAAAASAAPGPSGCPAQPTPAPTEEPAP
jgi:hypothetical protein